ncbi:MAG: Rieske (2Fe-2S) domain protein [Candidatus Hinthialibacteria bacterium OLB16]|nr:MAG: Rieske (2Fe-2S) domain protein [Candidatus Hinthialibacteria bacterium OLB16]
MAASELPVGSSRVVAVSFDDRDMEIIVVHTSDGFRAYLNQCRHLPVSLDWGDGEVLDETGLYFQCRTHGALFRLSDGLCIAGPCNGKPLRPVSIRESCGFIHFLGPGEMP